MSATGRSQDTRIKVLACRQVYSGANTQGHQYTIYEIDAAREDGSVINSKLRSFAELPVGQVVDVTVTPFDSERHGRSYTLQLKTRKGKSSVEQIGELGQLVHELSERLESLTKRVAALEGREEEEAGTAPPPEGAQVW